LAHESAHVLDLECEVHEVGLHLDGRAVGELADFNFLVAVRRAQEGDLRAARRDAAA
jgi:hypothetical protein